MKLMLALCLTILFSLHRQEKMRFARKNVRLARKHDGGGRKLRQRWSKNK